MIQLIHGDITKARVDAIVNAANSGMLGGGGVDGAIHRAAGPVLLKACEILPVQNGIRCPVGEARITAAGALGAKFVIHAVGPRFGRDTPSDALLESAYRNSFTLALENHCTSIALPAISCGVFAYPVDHAGAIAMAVSREFEESFERIEFYLMPEEVYHTWSQLH
ncbi:O-acetyl-ADP-ribose deacetylase [Thalassocella blandensis]|nr:O-acetyl-ADP-ribose deacetylase [Thalassocella blandensis]